MLINYGDIIDIAEEKSFAVPAFNTYNMETTMGIIQAAEEAKAPVILQCYSRLITSDEGLYLSSIILAAINNSGLPICFHLDHGINKEQVIKGIKYGCSGIMYDASLKKLPENICETKYITRLCHHAGIHTEGELGHIGGADDDNTAEYTKIDEAKEFVSQTGVSALAVLVGNAHGRYTKAPQIDIKRISEIRKAVGIPLVLHGGSGIPDEQITSAIKAGVRKVNFGTDICYSFLDKVFETPRKTIAIDLFMKDAIENVKQYALQKIKLLGAENKA